MPVHPNSLANLRRGGGRAKGSRNAPKPTADRVRAAAGRASLAAVKTLARIAADPTASAADRIRAACAILDRAVGRPPTAVEIGGAGLTEGELRARFGLDLPDDDEAEET